eukprot:3431614-Pyramimonas_sp.AAC.1
MEIIWSAIRWMPHPLMPVDCMTKSDLAKINAAQLMLIKSGMLRPTAEESSILERKGDPRTRGRSRAESTRQLQ